MEQFLFISRPFNAEVVMARTKQQNNISISHIFSQYNICILWPFTINFQVPVSVWLAELFISVCLDLSISVTVSLFCDNYVWQISFLPIILLLQPDWDFLSPLLVSQVQLLTINSYSNSVGL